jgi:hypothetical protein
MGGVDDQAEGALRESRHERVGEGQTKVGRRHAEAPLGQPADPGHRVDERDQGQGLDRKRRQLGQPADHGQPHRQRIRAQRRGVALERLAIAGMLAVDRESFAIDAVVPLDLGDDTRDGGVEILEARGILVDRDDETTDSGVQPGAADPVESLDPRLQIAREPVDGGAA